MPKHLLKIIINGARTFIVPASLFLVALLITKIYSKDLWGELVVVLLLINLIALFSQWGNKEYLIRSYNTTPALISSLFYSNLFSRSFLLVPAFMVVFFISNDAYKASLLCVWTLSQFVYLSSESIVIYSKSFLTQLLIEITAIIVVITFILVYQDITLIQLIGFYTLATLLKALAAIYFIYPKFSKPNIHLGVFTKALPFFIVGLSGLLQSRVDQYIIAIYEENVIIGSYQIFLSSFILLQAFSAIIIVPFTNILYRINIQLFNKIFKKLFLASIAFVLIVGCLISWFLLYVFQLDIPYFYFAVGILFAFPPFLYGPIIYQYYRIKKEKEVLIINYLGAFINLIFTFIVVYYNHPFAAIVGGAISQWTMLVWYLKRKKYIWNEIEMSRMSS
ncbi:MAG: O-antigen/teichoic acid export membrane protein [Flavobacteriales bacterium]|jgi:O-antigen/teichoic acid export membrane protein